MAKKNLFQSIALHTKAPVKPAVGAVCNGCGICCASETCPVGWVLFLQRQGPCPALLWNEEGERYSCGLLDDPARYLRWLPHCCNAGARRFFARRIAVGQGCDCLAELVIPAASVSSDKRQS